MFGVTCVLTLLHLLCYAELLTNNSQRKVDCTFPRFRLRRRRRSASAPWYKASTQVQALWGRHTDVGQCAISLVHSHRAGGTSATPPNSEHRLQQQKIDKAFEVPGPRTNTATPRPPAVFHPPRPPALCCRASVAVRLGLRPSALRVARRSAVCP